MLHGGNTTHKCSIATNHFLAFFLHGALASTGNKHFNTPFLPGDHWQSQRHEQKTVFDSSTLPKLNILNRDYAALFLSQDQHCHSHMSNTICELRYVCKTQLLFTILWNGKQPHKQQTSWIYSSLTLPLWLSIVFFERRIFPWTSRRT